MSDYKTEVAASLHHDEDWPYDPAEYLRSAVVVESGEWGDAPAVSLEVTCMGESGCVRLTPAEALRVAEALSRMARLAIDPEEVTRD